MRLLISANTFFPAVGGYEAVALILAKQLALRGHSVRVVTFTTSESKDVGFPFEIYRNPSMKTLWRLLFWCDLYVQNNVSYKLLWPVFFVWRPLVCIHHSLDYTQPTRGMFSWRHRLKQVVTLFSTNIAVSNAVSKSIWGSSHVIPNPYEDRDFYRITTVEKSSDLIFVGRLVSEKGVDILLQALARLQKRGVKPSLTIVGSGPEERNLRELSEKLDLAGQVTFVGEQTGVKLNQLLNAAKIMVVPSRREGFGVVALEGIACDCVVVGSNTGGLPEAIGRCGETFMSGSSASLADVLDKLLTTPNLLNKFLKHVDKHLRMHKPGIIGDKYAAVFQNAKHGTRKPH